MSELAEVQSIGAKSLTSRLAARFGVDENKMIGALKATAFKSKDPITNEQMMALCVVSEQYGLNPWTKEIYAFPDKTGGIVPVVGVDGWARIINSHPQFDGMDFEQDDMRCTCVIYRKDRSHPIKITEFMAECRRSNVGPWQTHPNRMLRHKAMIQCARIAFGYGGIYDQDEAERIVEGEVVQMESKPKRSTSVTQTVIDEQKTTADPTMVASYVEQIRDAVFNRDDQAIRQLYAEIGNDKDLELVVHRSLSSADRSYVRDAQEIQNAE